MLRSGIAVEVDEDNYLRCTGSESLSDGSEASEDDRDDIRSAIRLSVRDRLCACPWNANISYSTNPLVM